MLQRKKQGFTLIEMLVVIAIIAVLVSIMVPTVSGHLTKANAAANAANMRAIKGQVSTMMLQGQINYKTSRDNTTLIGYIDQASNQTDSNLVKVFLRELKEALDDLSTLTEHYNNTYYAEDGVIDIDGVKLNAPAAKAVDIEGFKLRKNTQMAVTVAENEIIVTYGGVSTDVFALIAQDGEGTNVGEFDHTYVDGNSDFKCDVCGESHMDGILDFEGAGEIAGGIIEGAVSGQTHTCQDTSGDCYCDIDDCGLPVAHVDADGRRDEGYHFCDKCGECTGYAWGWNGCSYCGKSEAEHAR